MTIIRPLLRSWNNTTRIASRATGVKNNLLRACFSTQSGDDAAKPLALAKLHLEDGTTLTGTSFGSHEAVEGEVRFLDSN